MSTSNFDNVRIIGGSVTVVEHCGLTINECIGNVATSSHDAKDKLSLALVTIAEPASEPWLTIDYDEYIHVTEGYIELHLEDDNNKKMIKVSAGQTVFLEKGSRFRPIFPVGNTKYIPLCLPAFSPERCQREDETVETSDVADKLKELHNDSATKPDVASNKEKNYDNIGKIYHMCQKSLWDESSSQSKAYFPPTFHHDGKFTHATAVPQRLITTANHFYTATVGDWICLELDRWELEKCGIVTVFEEAMPVGESDTNDTWGDWVCPHIYVSLQYYSIKIAMHLLFYDCVIVIFIVTTSF